MDMQTFLDTDYSWKFHRLLVSSNSSDAKLRMFHKAVISVKQCTLLFTTLGVPASNPTKYYEYNESVVHTVTSHRIPPLLWHVVMPIFSLSKAW